MKFSPLQQELYEYKNSQLQQNQDYYTTKIEQETSNYNDKQLEFETNLNNDFLKKVKEFEGSKYASFKKSVKEERLSKIQTEKEKILQTLLVEFEKEMTNLVKNVVNKASTILNCKEKDLEIKASLYLIHLLNFTSGEKLSIDSDSSLDKYEFICKNNLNLVRFNLKDEIFSVIQREVREE